MYDRRSRGSRNRSPARVRNRSPRGIRNRSPPSKSRDLGSEWRSNPYHGTHGDEVRSLRRTIRSVSPMERERTRRGGGDRRSASLERRDYTRHLDLDNRNLPDSPVGQTRDRLHFCEDFPRRESPSSKCRREYLRTGPREELDIKANHNVKYAGISEGGSSSRASKDNNFQPNRFSSLDGHGIPVQKSMGVEDGTVRTFLPLPSDGGYSSIGASLSSTSGKRDGAFLSSSFDFNIGRRRYEDLQYRDRLSPTQMFSGVSYEEEKKSFYPRDASYYSMPSSHSKALGSTSSGLGNDDFVGSYEDGLRPQSTGFVRSTEKFLDSDGYRRAKLFESRNGPELPLEDMKSYQLGPLSPSRDLLQNYRYPEFSRRDKGDTSFLSDDLYKNMQPSARGDYAHKEPSGSSFVGLAGHRIDDSETSHRNLTEGLLWSHHSLPRDLTMKYHDGNEVPLTIDRHGDFLGSGTMRLGFETKASRGDEIRHFERDYGFGRDASPLGYRARLKSPQALKHDLDIYRPDLDHQRRSSAEKLGVYCPSERMLKRNIVDETNRHYPRSTVLDDESTFGRFQELGGKGEQWVDEEWVRSLPSKKLGFRGTQNRMHGRLFDGSHRLSLCDAWLSSDDVPIERQGCLSEAHHPTGRKFNIKKRLKPGPSDYHGSFFFHKKQEYQKRYKFQKGAIEDRHASGIEHAGDLVEDTSACTKCDPPEGSEEFNQQVHRAFLRFCKQLNENPAQQRRYQEQGKVGNLLCSACGSVSEEFADTHSLVTHAFHSLKVGLRTDHLGLHKALCVLMGWNSLVVPDTGRLYQSLPAAEVSILKEDLILWPPLVIMHNASIGNKRMSPQVIKNERMEEILREMGFSGGKTKVCRGKPGNNSILLVKFMPTFSGLQEAEKLHKYYAENKRGRKELQQMASTDSHDEELQNKKVDLLLYGYLGIAEDMNKLDFETKRRCLVKSKKEIEAIAEAPLRAG